MNLLFFIFPVILLIGGIALYVKPPVKINPIYGFRTRTSSRNEQTWAYCNQLTAKIMIADGILSVIALMATQNVTTQILGVLEMGELINIFAVAVILLSIPFVNHCCKKKFPESFRKEDRL